MVGKNDLVLPENLWKVLRHYLKVEMDVEQPENVASNRGYPGGMAAPVHIRLLNSAPAYEEHPRVVFTGISVVVKSTKGQDSLLWAHQGKKEVQKEPAEADRRGIQGETVRAFGTEFPDTTPGELEWGDSLFPGQSATYCFYVPVDYVPFIEFEVQANVSRRHFFRFAQTLRLGKDSTDPVGSGT